jgi:hypothetical protein
VVNYFAQCKQLTNKASMAQHLAKYGRKHPQARVDRFMPLSFAITHKADCQLDALRRRLEQDELDDAAAAAAGAPRRRPVWIAKGDALAKGDGIVISESAATLLAAVAEGRWVVQEYCDDPMLVHGRKFDIRVWVLVAPWRCAYVCSEAVLRLASVPYVPFAESGDQFVHLTNHCIQTAHPDYGAVQQGNEMFLGQFAQYLEERGAAYGMHDYFSQVNHIVRHSLRAVEPLLYKRFSASGQGHLGHKYPGLSEAVCARYSHALGSPVTPDMLADGGAGAGALSFQLLGYDFLLTAGGEMQLLEVNASPAAADALSPRLARDMSEIMLAPFECGDVLRRYEPQGATRRAPGDASFRIPFPTAVGGASLGNLFYPLDL